MIRLQQMDVAAYDRWQATSMIWPESEALDRSAQSYRELLPDGLDTPGHVIRSIVNEGGEQVGHIWWAPKDVPSGRVAFIYDIAVYPEFRRRGYAQAALATIEASAREHGLVGVQLHVHGPNIGARRLCQWVGFVETDVTMLKRVDG